MYKTHYSVFGGIPAPRLGITAIGTLPGLPFVVLIGTVTENLYR